MAVCYGSLPILLANMQFRLSYSQRYLVVGLVGLVGLLLTVTVRVSRVSTAVSVRVSVRQNII